MRIPTFLIMLPLVFAFAMFVGQFYVADPDRRITDHRFLLATVSVGIGLLYLLAGAFATVSPPVSMLAFAAALCLVVVSFWTRRAMKVEP